MSVSLILLDISSPKKVLGDATISGFRDQIAVETFSWGVSAKTIEKQRGEPKTEVEVKTLSLTKQFDRSSTVLCQMMETDKPFQATLRFIDPTTKSKGGGIGEDKFDSLLEIDLIECYIEDISLSATDSGKAVSVTERLVLSFAKSITFHYRSYDPASRSRTKAMTAIVNTPANEPKSP